MFNRADETILDLGTALEKEREREREREHGMSHRTVPMNEKARGEL